MLRKGQIKFSKKAAIIAKKIFEKKKVNEFLVVVKNGEPTPSGAKDIYKKLLGVKQDASNKQRIYTTDVIRSEKLFLTSLFQEGQFSLIASPTYACALYITKDQESKFEKIKLKNAKWPTVFIDESNSAFISRFDAAIKKAVDLTEILIDLEKI